MKITPQQFLDKLAANPQLAAEFDSNAPGESRRDHVVRTLNLVENTIAFNKAAKQKLAAARAKIAALEKAKASLGAMKAYQKQTGDHTVSGFLKQTKPAAVAKPKAQAPAPTPTATAAPAPPAAPAMTAADFEPPVPQISLLEFNKLSPRAKSAFCLKTRGKITA